jgi:hypothetical protein
VARSRAELLRQLRRADAVRVPVVLVACLTGAAAMGSAEDTGGDGFTTGMGYFTS